MVNVAAEQTLGRALEALHLHHLADQPDRLGEALRDRTLAVHIRLRHQLLDGGRVL